MSFCFVLLVFSFCFKKVIETSLSLASREKHFEVDGRKHVLLALAFSDLTGKQGEK